MADTKVEGPDPLLGACIAGRYTVMRKIARGGMGVVYLAVQEGLGRAVALKIIRRDVAADPVMQKRFEREAKAASALGHPSIVTVYDFGRTDDGELFLAMEFVDGDVLRDVIKRKKRLTFQESLPIIESVCAALTRAHAAGVVHRDLKPENIMLPRQSVTTTGAVAAKILDFGLAKPHDPDMVEEHLTRDGGFVGTPGYAAPEQTEGAPENPRQDLYALGVVWFEMLAGEHPFAAPTPMKTVVRQLNEEPPRLEATLPDVPHDAAVLIRALMARRAEDRPASAQAVVDAIVALKRAPAVSAPSPVPARGPSQDFATVDERAPALPAPPPAPPVPTPPPPSSSRAPLYAGAIAIALLAGAVLVLALHEPRIEVTRADGGPMLAVHVEPVPPPKDVQIFLDGVPTFTALQAVRNALPHTSLARYARERSELVADGADASPLAELLQGRVLLSDLPLVLEVKELAPGRVVAAAVRPEDASALQDGGLIIKDGGPIPDAGAVTVETAGGLTP